MFKRRAAIAVSAVALMTAAVTGFSLISASAANEGSDVTSERSCT